jgi:hypothetical protein
LFGLEALAGVVQQGFFYLVAERSRSTKKALHFEKCKAFLIFFQQIFFGEKKSLN